MKHTNLLQTIGNTPLIKLNNLHLKLEGQNPGGSIKDRVALFMIEQAEKRGELMPGKTIIEATSGNMGISLAMIGAAKDYKVKILMSEAMSDERKRMLKALGAELILTDSKLGTLGAIKKARQLVKNNPQKYWFANQFNNPDNINSHYNGIAPELSKELKHIDYIVAGMGTTGTVMGMKKYFNEHYPKTKIIAVIPPAGYKIQGLQNPEKDFKGDIYSSQDLIIQKVSNTQAYKTSRQYAKKHGLFIGMSSGAAIYAAEKISTSLNKASIVVIIPDRGEKYLSTKLYN